MACWSVRYGQRTAIRGHCGARHTVGVALNLNNHLLQSVDCLLAALLWHLLLEILVGLLAVLASLLLLVLVDILINGLLGLGLGSLGGIVEVKVSGLVALLSIFLGNLRSVGWVAGAVRVGSLCDISSSLLGVALADWNLGLDLAPNVVLAKVRSVVPRVVWRWLVEVLQLLLVWLDGGCRVLCRITSDVADQDRRVAHYSSISIYARCERRVRRLTEFAELAVGDDELAEGAKSLEGLVAVLLGCLLVYWRTHGVGIAGADVLSLPDKLLEQVALVLGEKQQLGLLDDSTQIAHQLLAVGRQLLGWVL